jgi:hypothetical protein
LHLDRTATLTLRPRAVGPVRGEVRIDVKMDALGGVRFADRPLKTELESALQQPDLPPKSEMTPILTGLPKGVVVTVIIQFAQPLAPDAYERVRAKHNLPAFVRLDSKPSPNPRPQPPFGEDLFVLQGLQELEREGLQPEFPIVWPGGDLGEFRRWTQMLRPHDDQNLAGMFLPPSRTFQRVAQDLRIRAVVLKMAVRDVQGLLADAQIAGIRLIDAGFDLRGTFFPG